MNFKTLQYLTAGILFWACIGGFLFWIRPGSRIHKVTMESLGRRDKVLLVAVLAAVILGTTIPMSWCPIWNGMIPDHRNQYEVMAESLLEGKLYLDYGEVPEALLTMENPYDIYARQAHGVDIHSDHVFYNGRYYMYFGVVPALLLFVPYRMVTGHALTTYHATQVFTGLLVLGFFLLFGLSVRRFFPKMTLAMYGMLAVAFPVMSIWYSIAAPALYCTAITAGICLEIWSLYFFARAVWVEEGESSQIGMAFLGALCGALVFGCRPPIGIANILVLPMLAIYLRGRRLTPELIGKLVLAAAPYAVVGALLMLYNYARFGSPFEFGQAYQLTMFDQQSYGNFMERFSLAREINGLLENFISYSRVTEEFPFIGFGGLLVNFPILLLISGMGLNQVWKKAEEKGLKGFLTVLLLAPVLITLLDAHWAPDMGMRYRQDVAFLMGILCFMVLGLWHSSIEDERERRKFSHRVTLLGFLTLTTGIALFLIPFDSNITQYDPGFLEKIRRVVMLAG